MIDMFLSLDIASLSSGLSGYSELAVSWLDSWAPPFAAEASLVEKWGTRLYNILLVALGLGFVIFVHELGHFLAAKMFGVKCEKFYVGFDVPIKLGPIRLPSKLFHFQWGETEYGIGAIPLGGYVKMLGQDDDPRRAEAEAQRIRSENPNAPEDDPSRVQLDPRSFPAKSVGARMVIISAGVVMNLIFGVLMAAWAFSYGVPYEPSVIGELNPGDPAWKNDIRAGDKIVQVGTMKDEELSFRDMFMSVLFHGLRNPKAEVELGVHRDGETLSKKFPGTTVHSDPKKGIQHLTLGLRSAPTTRINPKAKSPVGKNITLGIADSEKLVPKLLPADVLVGLNGQPLPISSHSKYPMEYSLNAMLHPRLNETVTLQVERPDGDSTKKLDVEWPAIPMKSFGLRFKPGPVASVLDGSPAAKAGVKEGDTLIAFNGTPIQDAFTLLLAAATMKGKSVALTLERASESPIQFEWEVPEQFTIAMAEGVLAPIGLELPGSGLVYSVSNVVNGVVAESTAAKSGLQAGDVVKQFQFVTESKEDKEYLTEVFEYGSKTLLEEFPVDKSHNTQYFQNLVQNFRSGMPVKIDYERDGKVATAKVNIHTESEWFWPDRGLSYSNLEFQHKATNVATALSMGSSEIWRRMGNVLEFLEMLVKGRMPFNLVGGPGMIAVEATDAASKGISPLLMFLVMLSANLAIINFLPIPALDGGHMMFLTAEAVRGKPVDEALQMKLTMAGVLGLLCLMGAVIINDSINLTRMFGG
jgi:regulator of sigma E protease